MDLKGKTAFVTGGSGDIGGAIARVLAAAGADVAVSYVAKRLPEEIVRTARSQVVLGRTASALDIADQVVTFCRAESITGQVLVIDGGMPGGMH